MPDVTLNGSPTPKVATLECADGKPAFRYQQLERFHVPPGFRGRSRICVQLWWLVQSTLFAMSPQAMYGWRVWLLRLFGAKIGRGAIIRPSVKDYLPLEADYRGSLPHRRRGASLYTYGEIEIETVR